ncbi:MAG: HEPN domain-containing protein [Deltaproteobacteria bacterium]|nr:HEPN domain-containing protein [Deltaproteobacteria bacterium]
MSTDEKQKLLALHRLQQATESIEEAHYLFKGGKSLRSVANRVYYGMFYAVLALLIYEPYASSKHSGVLAYFNKRFVKSKIFSESMGRSLNKAFELRQRGDYREYFELANDQVEPLLNEASQFVASIRKYLDENIGWKEDCRQD